MAKAYHSSHSPWLQSPFFRPPVVHSCPALPNLVALRPTIAGVPLSYLLLSSVHRRAPVGPDLPWPDTIGFGLRQAGGTRF
jgi:hypothetical protein